MHILMTGAAGMIGRKLTARLIANKKLNGKPIERLTLLDVSAPERPGNFSAHVTTLAADLADPAIAAGVVAGRPDVIFHLGGVVSGEAELDFEKGVHVNFDGSRALLEASARWAMAIGRGSSSRRRSPCSARRFRTRSRTISRLTPLTSYGTQKAMGELMLADYTRRGISRRRRHPAAEYRGAARKAEQGGVGLFLRRSSASRSTATRPCCRWPRVCAIGTQARARPWAF